MEILENNNDDLRILWDFAKRTQRIIEFEEVPYPTYYGNRLTKYRTTVYIKSSKDESIYFVCFWDPFLKIGKYTNFSGIFIPIPLAKSVSFVIRKRNILDSFNLFSKSKILKTSSSDFDSKVIINGNNQSMMPRVFRNAKAQKLFISALDIKQALIVGINEVNIDFVPGFKGTSHIGIYSRQEWFLDPSQIEKLFETAEQLKRLMTIQELEETNWDNQ